MFLQDANGRLRLAALSLAALAGTAVMAPSAQATYPDRPVSIVVPYGAGGGTDSIARFIGQKLSKAWGQPVVVENKPGAGGSIGSAYVARAKPDGYTLVLATNSSHGINPAIYKNLQFDVAKDFDGVSIVATTPMLMAVPAGLGVRSVPELAALVKSKPGKLNYVSSGNGTTSHLSGESFARAAQLDISHVPYSNTATALTDLLADRATFMFDNIISLQPHIMAGRLTALAVTTAARSPTLPDVPSLKESGYDIDITGWFGILAPAGTPKPVLEKLSTEITAILKTPGAQEKLRGLGTDPYGTTPEQTDKFIEDGLPRWKKLVDDAHIDINK